MQGKAAIVHEQRITKQAAATPEKSLAVPIQQPPPTAPPWHPAPPSPRSTG
jgi:hypothetical protein